MAEEMPKVLIVDDDPSLTELLVDTLEVIGYESRSASSAHEALDLIRDENFSLVITDINMPEMSGIELLQEIKKVDAQMPVMLITGVGTDTLKQEAFEFGADGFLSKPFRIGKIEAEIGNLLKGIHRHRVLVVDDNAEFLNSSKERLEAYNNVVYTASTVGEALNVLRAKTLDLVITDLRLPDGEGTEVYRFIKLNFPDLPVILVTAFATSEVLERIRQTGITRFMAKPLDYDRLETELDSCFSGSN